MDGLKGRGFSRAASSYEILGFSPRGKAPRVQQPDLSPVIV